VKTNYWFSVLAICQWYSWQTDRQTRLWQ